MRNCVHPWRSAVSRRIPPRRRRPSRHRRHHGLYWATLGTGIGARDRRHPSPVIQDRHQQLCFSHARKRCRRLLLAVVVAALCATCVDAVSNDQVLIVGASIVGSTTGYYGLFVIREMMHTRRVTQGRHLRSTRRAGYSTVRTVVVDFGSAELLDSFLFSPVLLYLCIQAVPNLQLAVLLGELASTIAFYSVVFVVHAVRRAFSGAANELACHTQRRWRWSLSKP